MGPNLLVSLCMLDKTCIANRAQFGSESFTSKVKPLLCNNSYSENALTSVSSLKSTTDLNSLYLN